MLEDPLKKQFEQIGWNELAPQTHFGEAFDLVGSRRFMVSQWSLLVRYINALDQEEMQRCAASLLHISAMSKSFDQCFITCIVAGKLEIELEQLTEAGESFGLFGVLGLLEGGGNVFIADMERRTIHGTVPSLPYAVRTFSKDLQGMFQDMFAE